MFFLLRIQTKQMRPKCGIFNQKNYGNSTGDYISKR
jgi:hypothetical protein